MRRKRRDRRINTAKELLAVVVGSTLSLTFVMIVGGIMWALIFVTQPVRFQSPNDKAFIDSVLVPIVLFLSGALSGVLASNGLSKESPKLEVNDDDSV